MTNRQVLQKAASELGLQGDDLKKFFSVMVVQMDEAGARLEDTILKRDGQPATDAEIEGVLKTMKALWSQVSASNSSRN